MAYPTEAVYGLGCDPWNAGTFLRLLTIKHRGIEKGVILIGASFSQLLPFVEEPEQQARRRLDADWPGPVSWLLPVRPGVPYWLTGGRKTLAVRVTAHREAALLCDFFGGALVSTSANISGRAPARSALGVRRRFGSAVDYVLTGQVGSERQPSEIRDAFTDRVIRSGSSARVR